MGVELGGGSDLRVIDGRVKMRTTRGYEAIDVLYRRVDDDFLDPLTFRRIPPSGYRGSWMSIAPSNITSPMPRHRHFRRQGDLFLHAEIVEFYTGPQTPCSGNVPTWRCSEPESLKYVLEHLAELVVKEVHGSGGYGMLVGPTATKMECAAFAEKLKSRPGNYIAQPTLSLSTVPIMVKKGIAPRHGRSASLCARLRQGSDHSGRPDPRALKEGSLVVNSSQGGGTKDTWVLED